MKCHYEVLEVSRDADGPEIKSAYRKLALKWHPDKNPDSPSEAKEHFQVVQQAYEVLSDPHERAWYDKHREQILRGSSSEFQDSSLDVFPYFTPSCFKGYHDDEGGFYTVYRKVFDLIIKEDSEFVEDRDEFAIPRFGDSKSDYDSTVGPFYAHWTSYCTKKTYVWLYPYDIKQARDRRLSKLVEKENKKVRQKAKKERNEEIRNLVAFVRKRDRRVLDHSKVMESRVRENRLKQEEFSKQKRLERQKFLAESHVQADWAKFDNVQSELEEIEKNLAEEFGEEISEEEEDLYCVACNKVFKTAKAFQNHESSKKHRENVERIREELESEETAESEGREKNVPVDLLGEEEELDSEECSEGEDEIRRQRKKNKRKNVLKLEEEEEEEPVEFLLGDPGENFDFTSKKQKKKNSKKSKSKVENGNDEETETRSKRKNKKEREPSSLEEVDVSHCCVTCRSHFASKNKLFDHLKKTGHGVYLPKSAKSKKNKEIIV